ncbi:MAG: UDP-N-acetylmuramoyl-L-alanine--D-glutamate ligase, partial [Puniceicoccales bacterium]
GGLIAITGTNGKSTLTEFLVHALQATGSEAFAAGNVGFPLSRFFESNRDETATAVCEVSSFQAENLRAFRPQALLWTNVSEDHLDRHGSMRGYFAAKWRLVERLSRPRLFIGPSVAKWAGRLGYQLPPFTVVVNEDESCGPEGSPFAMPPQSRNYALAKAFWDHDCLELGALEEAAKTFKLSPHRLAVVAEFGGVRFWNDSVATNFSAAEAALASVPEPVVWIGGGRNKGGDMTAFAERIAHHFHAAVLLGESSESLADLLTTHGARVARVTSLELAVKQAQDLCPSGGSVLFSPGFASFDMFKNYADRGEQYCRAVLGLKASQPRPTVTECVEP